MLPLRRGALPVLFDAALPEDRYAGASAPYFSGALAPEEEISSFLLPCTCCPWLVLLGQELLRELLCSPLLLAFLLFVSPSA